MIEILLSSALGNPSTDEDQQGGKTQTTNPTMWAFSILLSCMAAYVPWTCNTHRLIPTAMKVVYAFFAFLFGGLYLLMYAVMSWGSCKGKP